MKYFIKQLGDKDCGITCLKMLLARIYKKKDFLFYPESNIDKSYSLSDLMKIAKTEGVNLSGYRLIKKEDIKKFKHQNLLLICKEKDEQTHMVLVEKINKYKIVVKDPKRGIIKYKYKDFFKIWEGTLLEVIGITGSDFKIKNLKIVKTSTKIITNLVQIITYLFFAAALYFTNTNSNFLISLSLFLGFILMSVIFQRTLLFYIKKFDNDLLQNFYHLNTKFKDNYDDIVKFKKLLIINPISLSSTILITLFSIIVLGINSYLNLISVGILILFLLILKLFTNNFLKNKSIELEKKEINLKKKNLTDEETKNLILEIDNSTYDIAKFESLKKYIIIFLIIVLTLFLAALQNQVTLNFILFDFFIYLYISENLQKIIDYDKNIDELNYYKSLFFYYSNNA